MTSLRLRPALRLRLLPTSGPDDDSGKSLPPKDELFSMYEDEKARSGDSTSAIAFLASAHGASPDQVRSKLISSLERSRSQPL